MIYEVLGLKSLDDLWAYQAAEIEYEEFEESVKNTETRKKMVQYQKLFASKQELLKKLESDSAGVDSSLNDISTQIAAISGKIDDKKSELTEMAGYDPDDLFLQDVKESSKECASIKTQLEAAKKKAVECKKQLEKINEEIVKSLKTMSAAKKEFDKLKAQYSEEIASKSEEIENLKSLKDKAAGSVEPELLEKYKGIKARWKNPVAKVNDDRCSGCNMQLPMSVVSEVKAGKRIVECDSCGRILYFCD